MLRDERFYPSFKQNVLYVRMLAELDMLKDPSFRGSDDGEGGELCISRGYFLGPFLSLLENENEKIFHIVFWKLNPPVVSLIFKLIFLLELLCVHCFGTHIEFSLL